VYGIQQINIEKNIIKNAFVISMWHNTGNSKTAATGTTSNKCHNRSRFNVPKENSKTAKQPPQVQQVQQHPPLLLLPFVESNTTPYTWFSSTQTFNVPTRPFKVDKLPVYPANATLGLTRLGNNRFIAASLDNQIL
jgi:hypothetical protein